MLKYLFLSTALFSGLVATTGAQADPATSFLFPAATADPAIVPAPTHLFQEMLAFVYQNNPQLKAERDSLRALDERAAQETSGFRPQLALSGAAGEARVSQNNASWHYGQDHNLALVATQPVYNGATIGGWRAAKKRVMEGRAHLTAVEQKILYAAVMAWLDLHEKEQLLTLSGDNRTLSQTYVEATRQRLAAGDGTQTDIAIAESRAADGETRYAMALSARNGARAAFERATGLPAQATDLPPVPAALPQSSAEAAACAKSNPELEQADYEVAATADDIESAAGARWPSVFLRGSVSDETAEELGLARLREDSITLNVSLPLYAGGAEFSKEREAKIAHEKSRYDAIAVTRNLTEEAQQSWYRFSAAQNVIQTAAHASQASERALNDISEEQKHGSRSLTEVLDAQAQSLNAQITSLQAQTNLRVEAYKLLATVGKLTAVGLSLPVTPYDPVAHYRDVAGRWFGTSIDAGGNNLPPER